MKMKLSILVLFCAAGFVAGQSGRKCNVPPLFRKECGWGGISPEKCEARGCCFDSSISGVKWCFKTSQPACWVLPNFRRECGWAGISERQCEQRGCCFNSNTRGVTWCFHKKANA